MNFKLKDYLDIRGDRWYLKIKVVPKSRETWIFAVLDNKIIKIRIRSAPENWKANKELIKYISTELNIKKDKIKIISWIVDQVKLICIAF